MRMCKCICEYAFRLFVNAYLDKDVLTYVCACNLLYRIDLKEKKHV